LKEAADQVINCSMELGGNAPFVVFEDADLDAALDGAMIAKMRNGGEACTAANRFFVHADVADDFAQGLADRMAGLRVGPGTDDDTQVGPLVNEDTVGKVDELVRGAVSAGSRVVTGGMRLDRPGFYFAPTVLIEVPADAAILREEIFGPVAPIVTFTDEAEAVRLANDTEFGLVSYVYTRDLARGLRVSEAMESGMVGLNRGLVSDPAAPFGGTKQSGIGREGGHQGMLDYLESKYVAVTW
jgi:succinate-semialdehyde dehydrogenase/glutarate-semialdehyde dehydrogenase